MTLDPATGELALTWKASNPAGTSGTSYILRRRLPAEAEFAFIGVTGTKRYVDSTLIAGPDSVQGQRADAAGPVSQIFTVNFGRAPGGSLAAFVAEENGGPRSSPPDERFTTENTESTEGRHGSILSSSVLSVFSVVSVFLGSRRPAHPFHFFSAGPT